MTSVTVKSVRDFTITATVDRGQVVVRCRTAGIIFSFPAAVWPEKYFIQAEWIRRLTPWWDEGSETWTPQAMRLRDACSIAVNRVIGEDNARTRKEYLTAENAENTEKNREFYKRFF